MSSLLAEMVPALLFLCSADHLEHILEVNWELRIASMAL